MPKNRRHICYHISKLPQLFSSSLSSSILVPLFFFPLWPSQFPKLNTNLCGQCESAIYLLFLSLFYPTKWVCLTCLTYLLFTFLWCVFGEFGEKRPTIHPSADDEGIRRTPPTLRPEDIGMRQQRANWPIPNCTNPVTDSPGIITIKVIGKKDSHGRALDSKWTDTHSHQRITNYRIVSISK